MCRTTPRRKKVREARAEKRLNTQRWTRQGGCRNSREGERKAILLTFVPIHRCHCAPRSAGIKKTDRDVARARRSLHPTHATETYSRSACLSLEMPAQLRTPLLLCHCAHVGRHSLLTVHCMRAQHYSPSTVAAWGDVKGRYVGKKVKIDNRQTTNAFFK